MQRKATRQSRGANAQEKAFMGWVKIQPCSFCNAPPPVILDHCRGSSFKSGGFMLGHKFINGKCQSCDTQVTQGARRVFFDKMGMTDGDATINQITAYKNETGISIASDYEISAIFDVYAVNDIETDWIAIL